MQPPGRRSPDARRRRDRGPGPCRLERRGSLAARAGGRCAVQSAQPAQSAQRTERSARCEPGDRGTARSSKRPTCSRTPRRSRGARSWRRHPTPAPTATRERLDEEAESLEREIESGDARFPERRDQHDAPALEVARRSGCVHVICSRKPRAMTSSRVGASGAARPWSRRVHTRHTSFSLASFPSAGRASWRSLTAAT